MNNMAKIRTNYYHKRLRDFEPIDDVRMFVDPRWKDSWLSGDEWRQAFIAELRFKGELIDTVRSRKLEDISLKVLSISMQHTPDGCLCGTSEAADKMLKRERETCDQPGCAEEPSHFMVLIDEYSGCGEKLAPRDYEWNRFRQFCHKHKERGDCGLEDADRNYRHVPRSEIYEEG